jgi:intracellular septation protein
MTDSTPKQAPKELGTGMRLLLDIGPLILFFIANYKFGIFTATAAFIVAILIAMMVSLALTRRVTALQLFSAVMVVVMGGLTLYFHNETFIKIKPTIYYGFVAMILGYGLLANKPILKSVLGSAYPGLDAAGWTKLTRNWALFFAVMAVVNEVVWRNTSTDFWIGFKMWGAIPATLLFALANVPMLMRHGLSNDEAASASEPGPVE